MIQTIKSGNTNCYLIKLGGAYTLIDAGTALDQNFLSKLQALVPLNQIELVVLTHGHYDHVGHAAMLQKDHGLKIAIHQSDFDKAANGTMSFPAARGPFYNCIRSIAMKDMEKAKFMPFHADIVFRSQEQLAQYPELQIVELPGHTPGSIGVLLDGNLFAGDFMMNLPVPSKARFAENFDVLEKSLQKMKNWNIRRIYPGHGAPFSAKWMMCM